MKFFIMRKFVVLLTGLALFACDNTTLENGPFKIGETTTFYYEIPRPDANEQFVVVFDELLQDSRCGTGLECIWEGIGIIKLTKTTDSKTSEITLSTFDWEEYSNSQIVDGLRFTLVSLKPYPKGEKPADVTNYTAEVLIESVDE